MISDLFTFKVTCAVCLVLIFGETGMVLMENFRVSFNGEMLWRPAHIIRGSVIFNPYSVFVKENFLASFYGLMVWVPSPFHTCYGNKQEK